MEGRNIISIQAQDPAGNDSTVQLTVIRDTQKPELTIISPDDGLIVNEAILVITGTVLDSTAINLSINSIHPKIDESGAFADTVILVEGENKITLSAVDLAGNDTTALITVICDTETPELTILSPAEDDITNNPKAAVCGTVFDSTKITLTINQMIIKIDDTGAFCDTLDLIEGENNIIVSATDAAGNDTLLARKVILDTTPPLVTVLSPGQDTITKNDTLFISGQVIDSSDIFIVFEMDSFDVHPDGDFEFAESLDEGMNTISFDVFDIAGNQTTNNFNIYLDSQPPQIMLESPEDSLVIEADSITISGTIIDSTRIQATLNETSLSLDSEGSFSIQAGLEIGNNELIITATDSVGHISRVTRIVERISTREPLALHLFDPWDQLMIDTQTIDVTGQVNDPSARIKINDVPIYVNPDGRFIKNLTLFEGPNHVTVTAERGSETLSETRTVTYALPELPPDPVQIAPRLDSTAITPFKESITFLYTGENPIQTGMNPDTIEARRVAVLRGKVCAHHGRPLPGVAVTILNCPEFGQTLTREDGWFDMAVNGGGMRTLNYSKTGYLSIQQQINVPWRDYAIADSVLMTRLSKQATVISLSDSIETIQVAEGEVVIDERGQRQAQLFFPPNTQADMVFPDGSTQSLETITVRATEYTTGASGPSAMPADLPPGVAYTYCVELSVDEAMQAGADKVQFNRDVPVYLDNFLDIPTGIAVPIGMYDRDTGKWIPEIDGIVLKIIGISDGYALIDITGDEIAEPIDSLSRLGITIEETQRLASEYTTGKSLWRCPINHFSIPDFNFMAKLPPNAGPPSVANASMLSVENDCKGTGSIIGIQNQTLQENIKVTGTPYHICYKTDRSAGYKPYIKVPVIERSRTFGVKDVHMNIGVAGKVKRYKFYNVHWKNEDITEDFIWDGFDQYSRECFGSRSASIEITNFHVMKYDVRYWMGNSSFGMYNINGAPAKPDTMWTLYPWSGRYRTILNNFRISNRELGGWTIDNQQRYDYVSKTVIKGNGEHYKSQPGKIIDTIVQHDIQYSGQTDMTSLAIVPNGDLYYLETRKARISKVSIDKRVEIIIGKRAHQHKFYGDGGPAINAAVSRPTDIAMGPDGALYIADQNNHRIRKIDKQGIITTIAGTGTAGYNGENIPALEADLNSPASLTVTPQGEIYFFDGGWKGRIRKMTSGGLIYTILDSEGSLADSIPISEASINYTIFDMCYGPDDNLYFIDYTYQVRKITPDGLVITVAGGGLDYYYFGGNYSMPANDVSLKKPSGLTVSKSGNVYICESGLNRVLKMTKDSMLIKVGGSGDYNTLGDGGLAYNAGFNNPIDVAIDDAGILYVSERYGCRIRQIKPPVMGYANENTYISSKNGSKMYEFDNTGRHLSTIDPLTNQKIYQFTYNPAGLLTAITDMDSLITTVERDSNGTATAIISPFGQRTELEMDENGYLASVSNPNSETNLFTYTNDGLITSILDPRGGLHTYEYDSLDRLIRDDDPAGGYKTLANENDLNNMHVTYRTAEGRESVYRVKNKQNGVTTMTNSFENGLTNVSIQNPDGTNEMRTPDRVKTIQEMGTDPRFGMEAPIMKNMTVELPSGLTTTMTHDRVISKMAGNEVMGLRDETTVNGKTATSEWDGELKTFTSTSPSGRQSISFTDDKGRTFLDSIPGILGVHYTYDNKGFLTQTRQGDRTTAFEYDSLGRLSEITDPINRSTTMEYDAVGRVTRQTLADGREISYSYDESGNLTGLTPPGKPTHFFGHTPVNLTEIYLPPEITDSTGNTGYEYNLDRQLTKTILSDSSEIVVVYDTSSCGCSGGSKPLKVITPSSVTDFVYSETTGQMTEISYQRLNASGQQQDTLRFSYDGSLPLSVEWAGAVNGRVDVSYNNDFKVISQRVNGSFEVPYAYDNDGLLSQAGDLSISHDLVNGMMTGTSLDSITTNYDYTAYGELKQYVAQYGASDIFHADYELDDIGRSTGITETCLGKTNTFGYHYDLSGRLIQVQRNDTTISEYFFDDNGNRISYIANGDTVQGIYDQQDRMLQYGNATYNYNADGSLTFKAANGDTTFYQYDLSGNLTSVQLPGNNLIEYLIEYLAVYNPFIENLTVGRTRVFLRWV